MSEPDEATAVAMDRVQSKDRYVSDSTRNKSTGPARRSPHQCRDCGCTRLRAVAGSRKVKCDRCASVQSQAKTPGG